MLYAGMKVFRSILRLLRQSEGQDLSEYCLLTALLALIALGIFWHVSGGMQALWSSGNSTLTTATTVAEPAATGTSAGAGASSTSTTPAANPTLP